ncbi:MAG: lactonase family protein [Clostridia bacterium]|nr:lactonase family protein [Clostridia bacterium]
MIKSNEAFVYIGSWSLKGGKGGLGLYKFNEDTGEINLINMLNEELSYSYITLDQRRGILYCGVDTDKHPALRAGCGGCLYAYSINPDTGEITELNHVPTYCPQPSYVSVDTNGKFLVASMHSSMDSVTKVEKDAFGTPCVHIEFSDAGVLLYALNEDGSIGKLLDIQIHKGSGPKPRQLQPHAHCAVIAPQGDLFAACDKGNDSIYMYRIDKENWKLILNGNRPYLSRPGRAPRYCAFHPTLPFFFNNNEMEMEIDSYKYDKSGNLEHLSTVRSLPEDYCVPSGARYSQQDFQISPDGKYIYALAQGFYNGISVFLVDQGTAALKLIQYVPVDGAWPRGFSFSPNHKYLVVACLSSGDIKSFSIHENGTLTPTEFGCIQTSANCATFYKP